MSTVRPPSRRRHLALSTALFLVLGLHVGVWAVQLGALAAALALDPGALGIALSGAAAGGIATLLVGGRVADRFGRRTVLVLGFGISGLAFAALAGAGDLPAVIGAVVLYGLAISFVDLGANAVGADFEDAYATQALTGLQAGFSLGAVVGALSSAALLAAGADYRLVYLGLAAVFAVTALACARADLPRRRPTAAAETDGSDGATGTRWPRGVLFAAALLLVCFLGDGALEGFLALFLRRALDSGVLLSGVGVAVFHLASFLGRAVSGPVLARRSPRAVITGAGVLAAIGMAGALLSPTTWGAVVGMLVVGFAISPVVPSALSLAARSAPGRAARAVAFTTAVGYTSFLIAPLAVGALASATDLRVGLAVVVATSIGIAVLGLRWPERDRRTTSRAGRGRGGD